MDRYSVAALVLLTLLLPSSAKAAAANAVAIDGDTIKLGDKTIRLEGIDAPELRPPCLDVKGKLYRCGRAAKNALSKLLTAPVACSPSGLDRYGRTLAYCTAGSRDLSTAMVAAGWA